MQISNILVACGIDAFNKDYRLKIRKLSIVKCRSAITFIRRNENNHIYILI